LFNLPFSLRYVAQMTWKERTPALCGKEKVIDGWEKDFEYFWKRNPATSNEDDQSLTQKIGLFLAFWPFSSLVVTTSSDATLNATSGLFKAPVDGVYWVSAFLKIETNSHLGVEVDIRVDADPDPTESYFPLASFGVGYASLTLQPPVDPW